MEPSKVAREQQIAVFGESGSGKTVLLSSFYGDSLEPHFKETSLFNVVAEDAGQGTRLHQNFLGMKNSSVTPLKTRFASTSYSFSIKQRKTARDKAKQATQVTDMRLVWHDYPGEWFEEEPSTPEEAEQRVKTFRSLLSSDVALLLVDGQRLLDNSGEEDRYLKALLTNFGTGLLKLEDQLLTDGKPLVKFPRIWVLALSKSDLLPNLDVIGFRDLVVEKAGGEIVELSKVLAGFIEAPDALSVGEDFVLLSSAKFEAGKIEVTKRVGLQLILPIAAVLPFLRFVRWALLLHKSGKVAEQLLSRVGPLAALIVGKAKLPGPLGLVLRQFGTPLAEAAAQFAAGKLKELHDQANARHDYLTAVVTGFELDLDKGEKERILHRSDR